VHRPLILRPYPIQPFQFEHEQGKVVTVDYTTADGTATAPADYNATSGTLTFQPGETAKTVSVAVVGDTLFEGDETFIFVLLNQVNAMLAGGPSQPTATISDDDAAPSFSIAPASYAEGTACANNNGGLVVAVSGAAVRIGMGWLTFVGVIVCVRVCVCEGVVFAACRANFGRECTPLRQLPAAARTARGVISTGVLAWAPAPVLCPPHSCCPSAFSLTRVSQCRSASRQPRAPSLPPSPPRLAP
jgi:hypothetical protein